MEEAHSDIIWKLNNNKNIEYRDKMLLPPLILYKNLSSGATTYVFVAHGHFDIHSKQ